MTDTDPIDIDALTERTIRHLRAHPDSWTAVPNQPEGPTDPDDTGQPVAADGPDDPPAPPPPGILAEVAAARPDLDADACLLLAVAVAEGVTVEQRRRLVRRIVDDTEAAAAMRLDRAHVVTAERFVTERTTPPTPCLGHLVAEGHNALLTAGYKTGKTTFVLNAVASLVTGEPFLGTFEIRGPYRVALLNYELTVDDARARVQALGVPAQALSRLLIINLRGVGLSLTAPHGRRWLTDRLAAHRSNFAVVDTYGAASAPSVDNENDNAAARRLLMAWDAIKADTDVHTTLVTHHTGRAAQDEGAEHGRGATVLDDWCDIRLTLTKDRDTGQRFLASEGRSAYSLPESRLHHDPATGRLLLPEHTIGENRRAARETQAAARVAEVVADNPGILTRALRDTLGGNHTTQADAIGAARRRGLIHTHEGDGQRLRHYSGPPHPDTETCPHPAPHHTTP